MIKQAIGMALFATATHCVALSLGGPQGNVIIGRPLDLLIRGTIDADEALSGLCLEAELLYGDSRVPASAVSVSIHKLVADGTGILRVRSSQTVNEPVVTLVLKAGCSSRLNRSYALLADYLPQPVAVATVAARVPEGLTSARSGPAMPSRPAGAQTGVPASNARPVGREPAESESLVRLQPAQPRPAGVERVLAKHRPESARSEPPPPAPASAPSSKPAAGDSRLKLDLVALEAPVAGQAKAAGPEAAPRGTAMPQAEASSVAAGGDAGGAEQQRIREMVRELEGLRSEQQKMRAAVEAVNAQLAQAGAPRHLDPLVLGLLGLSGAALSALAWVWARSLRRQPLNASRRVRPG